MNDEEMCDDVPDTTRSLTNNSTEEPSHIADLNIQEIISNISKSHSLLTVGYTALPFKASFPEVSPADIIVRIVSHPKVPPALIKQCNELERAMS
jgi:hypothetical protein